MEPQGCERCRGTARERDRGERKLAGQPAVRRTDRAVRWSRLDRGERVVGERTHVDYPAVREHQLSAAQAGALLTGLDLVERVQRLANYARSPCFLASFGGNCKCHRISRGSRSNQAPFGQSSIEVSQRLPKCTCRQGAPCLSGQEWRIADGEGRDGRDHSFGGDLKIIVR